MGAGRVPDVPVLHPRHRTDAEGEGEGDGPGGMGIELVG